MRSLLNYYLAGKSPAMVKLKSKIKAIAPTSLPLLFWGEPGTGLTFYAKAIHATIRAGQFIPILCLSLEPETIKRQFLGFKNNPGWVEKANKGTIFLKQITDCSLEVQETLEQIIGSVDTQGFIDFVRVNGTSPRQSTVRFMASIVGDVNIALEDNTLHTGLFELFKNHGKVFHVPPLRERREDIPEIIHHLVQGLNTKYNKKIQGVNSQAMEFLQLKYDWPGNIEELKQTLDVVFTQSEIQDTFITLKELAPYLPTLKGTDGKYFFIKLKTGGRLKGEIDSHYLPIEIDSSQSPYHLDVKNLLEIIRVESNELMPRLKHFLFKLRDGSQITGKFVDEFIKVRTPFIESLRFRPSELERLELIDHSQ